MPEGTDPTDVERQYAAANETHYVAKDFSLALELYRRLIASHPDAREAGYSRSQVYHIVNAVVPSAEFLDAQIALAVACMNRDQTELPAAP